MRDRAAIWGHRGWAGRYPHNTALSIGAAFGLVDVVEIDVRRTADGELMLSHDPTIDGVTIADTPWGELRRLDLGHGQRPILLREALATFPDRRFDIEVKNSPLEPGFEPDGALAADVVEQARPGDLISSFHWPSLDAVNGSARDRGVDTGMLLDLDMPLADVLAHAAEHGHGTILPSVRLLGAWGPEEAIGAVHDAGLSVATWTVNEPDVAIRLARAGIDAIITDDPGRMTVALARPFEEDPQESR